METAKTSVVARDQGGRRDKQAENRGQSGQ